MKTNSILFTLLTLLLSACGAGELQTNLLVPDAAEQDEFLLGQDGTRQFRGHFLYVDQMVDPATDPTLDGVSGDFILTFLQANSDDHTKIWQVSGDLNGTVTVYNNPVADFKSYSLQTQNVDVEIAKPKHQNSALLSGQIKEASYEGEEGRLLSLDDGNCFRFASIGEMCWGEMLPGGPSGSAEIDCSAASDGESHCVVGASGNNAGHIGTSNIEDDPTSDND
ncbi:MAG: hypothetical protein QGI45_05805 [Myxococcota bacterium]|jgi:hypothetical protein|nr:hypothetical protein [Myxococcota bacterium]